MPSPGSGSSGIYGSGSPWIYGDTTFDTPMLRMLMHVLHPSLRTPVHGLSLCVRGPCPAPRATMEQDAVCIWLRGEAEVCHLLDLGHPGSMDLGHPGSMEIPPLDTPMLRMLMHVLHPPYVVWYMPRYYVYGAMYAPRVVAWSKTLFVCAEMRSQASNLGVWI